MITLLRMKKKRQRERERTATAIQKKKKQKKKQKVQEKLKRGEEGKREKAITQHAVDRSSFDPFHSYFS